MPMIIQVRSISTSQWQKYLSILRLDKQSSTKDIKDSFLKLSKVYHPDNKVTGSHTKFVELKEAYDALKDGHPSNPTPNHGSDSYRYYHDTDLSYEAHKRYRRQNNPEREYGFGGPYRNSRTPWEELRSQKEFRRHKDYTETFGQRGRPIASLTIILSAVAWMVIYSSALFIWDYKDKVKRGMSSYRTNSHDDYLRYQEYLKKKEYERVAKIRELQREVEEQRKLGLKDNPNSDTVIQS